MIFIIWDEFVPLSFVQVTTNLRRAQDRSNILLAPDEGNLPQQSVVVVSQLYTIDKSDLTDYIGTLALSRVKQIITGLKTLLDPQTFSD